MSAELPLLHEIDCPAQFRRHHIYEQLAFRCWQASVHFAVGTVEVAMPVRIHIHAERKAARSCGNHRIDKPVPKKIPGAVKGGRARRHVMNR